MIGRLWRRSENEPPESSTEKPETASSGGLNPIDPTDPTDPTVAPTDPGTPSAVLPRIEAQLAQLTQSVDVLSKQVLRTFREQLRSNELAERSMTEARQALNLARAAFEDAHTNDTADRFSTESGNVPPLPSTLVPPAPGIGAGDPPTLKLIRALMPVLDGLDAALASGTLHVQRLPDGEARETLMGWLDGQRLLRDRLLAIFEREGVRAIETSGKMFDPYRHMAVETLYSRGHAPGTISEERRRGYEYHGRVLRYAEVIVTTSEGGQP